MVIFNPIKWGFRYSEISPKVKATYNKYATIETNSTETCIYFGVIRSKVTVTINIIFENSLFRKITLVLYIGSLTHMISLWKNPIYFGVIRSKVDLDL
jgi:hypothetical protein